MICVLPQTATVNLSVTFIVRCDVPDGDTVTATNETGKTFSGVVRDGVAVIHATPGAWEVRHPAINGVRRLIAVPGTEYDFALKDAYISVLHCDGTDANWSIDNNGVVYTGTQKQNSNNWCQLQTDGKWGGCGYSGRNTQYNYSDKSVGLQSTIAGGIDAYEDFTLDLWVKPMATSPYPDLGAVAQLGDDAGMKLIIVGESNTSLVGCRMVNTSDAVVWQCDGQKNIDTANWHHIAVTRSYSIVRCFFDGEKFAETEWNEALKGANRNDITIHAGGCKKISPTVAVTMNGKFEEFRFIKGVAAWVQDFTPPTAPYTGLEI